MGYRDALMGLTVVMALAAAGWFGRRFGQILKVARQARPVRRTDQVWTRLVSTAEQVLLHRRMLRIRLSGILHFLIFAGFVVLFVDVVETVGEIFAPGFTVGPILAPLVDVFVLCVLVGIVLALYNRLVLRPERFHGSDERDAYIILGLIALIVVGIVVHDSFYPFLSRDVFHRVDPVAQSHFLGYALSRLWVALHWTGPKAAEIGYTVGYLMDIGVIFLFLAYLPYSKHLHIFLAIPNIFLRNLGPKGELASDSPQETMAVRDFTDMHWKDVLDLFTCTECGRCQAVCPAHAAGQPLSPKMVILDLRDALVARVGGAEPTPLAGGAISPDALWACTTCGACQEACPVFIEHVPKIVGLRAALLEDGDVPQEAQKVLTAWERQSNSFGQPARRRADWVKGLDFPVKDARREPVDWLWFVGDFASYDPRVQTLTRLVARLLHQAGVDFGILYESEVNAGNEALRVGEYGLFESLAEKNLAQLERLDYRRVFTTDPHSLNALRNEYRKWGFDRPVLHYTEAFVELIRAGRLPVTHPLHIRATYHDPCYLGRWNGVVEAPRELLGLLGVQLIEMPRHGAQSFCCGAGGGRIWMNEAGMTERPANQRIREALALEDVPYFVVACPKDVSMFTASVTAMGVDDRIRVVDMAELLGAATALTVLEPEAVATPS